MQENTYEQLIDARFWARDKYSGQKYGDKDYIYHIDHVESVAIRFGFWDDWKLRIICVLHDIVEDTDVTLDEVEERFGKSIRNSIDALTDRPGETKKEVFGQRTQYDTAAIVVKMFDRIANIEACLAENKTDLLKKYVSEHDLFKSVLCSSAVSPAIFQYLEGLVQMASDRVFPPLTYLRKEKSKEVQVRTSFPSITYTARAHSGGEVKVEVPIQEAYAEFGCLPDEEQAHLLDVMGEYLENNCRDSYDFHMNHIAHTIKDSTYPKEYARRFIKTLNMFLEGGD